MSFSWSHYDHVGGNQELKTAGVTIYGPAREQAKIPGLDVAIGAGDSVKFGESTGTVMDVGGHTLGHIAYYFPDNKTVFVGDSLFALGCGKMFEGTPSQFWTSLKRLRDLPDDTTMYWWVGISASIMDASDSCARKPSSSNAFLNVDSAHEYTESNAKFALSVEPGNAELQQRALEIKQKRSRGEPTVPSQLVEEKKTNPFLRADISKEIRKNVGVKEGDSDADAFAKVRRAKDMFRG